MLRLARTAGPEDVALCLLSGGGSALLPAPVTGLTLADKQAVTRLLGDAGSLADLGRHYGGDLYEAEVAYLVDQEWARTAEDILWRRSKLGLHLPIAAKAALGERFDGAALVRAGGR